MHRGKQEIPFLIFLLPLDRNEFNLGALGRVEIFVTPTHAAETAPFRVL